MATAVADGPMGERTMGSGTDAKGWSLLRPRAQWMRRAPTEAEARLWQRLRRGALGVRFRRQVVIGRFIVDFYCAAARLVVEVDGGVHDGRRDIDDERDRVLQSRGVRVLRVRNEEVVDALDAVVETIRAALTG